MALERFYWGPSLDLLRDSRNGALIQEKKTTSVSYSWILGISEEPEEAKSFPTKLVSRNVKKIDTSWKTDQRKLQSIKFCQKQKPQEINIQLLLTEREVCMGESWPRSPVQTERSEVCTSDRPSSVNKSYVYYMAKKESKGTKT